MAVVTRSNHNSPSSSMAADIVIATRQRTAMAKRKIKDAVSHSSADSSSNTITNTRSTSVDIYRGSVRSTSTHVSSDARHYQRARPSISVRTKDISWPVGSSSKDSPRPDDYDFLDSGSIRSSTPLSDSLEPGYGTVQHASPISASIKHYAREATFPLSRRRALTLAKKATEALSHPRSRRNDTAESLDSLLLTSNDANNFPLRSAVSDSGSVYAAGDFAGNSAPSPLQSPGTPNSAFSFVDLHSPLSYKSPVSSVLTASGGRLRRAGTLNGMSSPEERHFYIPPVAATTFSRRGQQSNSPDLSTHSTISTVVSISPTSTNRPTSLESGVSEGSAGAGHKRSPKKLLPQQQQQQPPPEDDDELRGPPPRDDWDIVFDRIKEYRATHEAPVDTVGCEALTEEETDPKLKRFRSLVSLMLSAQTRDEITAEAVRGLSQRLPGGLTPKALSEAPIDLIHECVRKVGFWQRKSNYIKEAARTCLEQYAGDIPRTVPQLLSLPGVGPKMAYLAMHAAWQDTQGIGVDTHVLRISHRLGWVSDSAKSPEATRHALESWMPRSLWRELNPLLVGLGQTVCRAIGPKCGECPVSQYCPSSLHGQGRSTSRGAGDKSRPRSSAGVKQQISQDSLFSETTELCEVDVEDLASMVRGAEHAVRSRKLSGGRSRQGVVAKAEFPEIPHSPLTKVGRAPGAVSTASADEEEAALSEKDGDRRRRIRARGSRRLRNQLKMPTLNDDDDEGNVDRKPCQADDGSISRRKESAEAAEVQLAYGSDDQDEDGCGISPRPEHPTMSTSHYFMRSRSNAASEEVRPEAKTDTVRSARAKATAEKLYSRRLSKSDMQWALGEDWDPEDSSSLSSLSDLEADNNVVGRQAS
ncbi:alpha,alpha-trehalase nth1 [Coemansia aciculifera]|uniref:Alpha,alpha-trehalase nth1 n=1 Tax=Coemansia aciculifera TaxID=417176 RepID=A0ACC1M8B5_9FUNG|nr:alpha,alpha-trehalase nth1 [Coemansia aciculifera]